MGHIGKLVKLAGGMLNTHSRYGDCRMEILAAHAAACGLPPDKVGEILACVTCDAALGILRDCGLREPVLRRVLRLAEAHLRRRGDPMEVGVVLFSREHGLLARSDNTDALLRQIVEG